MRVLSGNRSVVEWAEYPGPCELYLGSASRVNGAGSLLRPASVGTGRFQMPSCTALLRAEPWSRHTLGLQRARQAPV